MKKVTIEQYNEIIAATKNALVKNQVKFWTLPQMGYDPAVAYNTVNMVTDVDETMMQMPSQQVQDEILADVLAQYDMSLDDAPMNVRRDIMTKARPTMREVGEQIKQV